MEYWNIMALFTEQNTVLSLKSVDKLFLILWVQWKMNLYNINWDK